MKQTTSSHPSVVVDKDIQLKACPFCGNKAAWANGEQRQTYGNEQVYCTHCYATTVPDGNKEAAAAWWNDRAGGRSSFVGTIEAEIERLRVAHETKSSEASHNPDDTAESSVPPSPESVSGLARQAAEKITRYLGHDPNRPETSHITTIITDTFGGKSE